MTTIYSSLKLAKEPFSTSPDPAFFYQSSGHYTALNRLEISIRLKRGMGIILGDVGTGKTTLSRALLQAFYGEEDQYVFHMILDPSFKSEYQFLSHITKLFGISPFFRSVIDHREVIEKYLFQKFVEEGKTVVLVIDEGQKLGLPQLEILRTFLNYETNEYKMLQLVILGQMELLPRVKKVRNFLDRIAVKYIINPLDEIETGKMIDYRLRQAGYDQERKLFTSEAVQKVYQATGGTPRQIARICHHALELLIAEERESVSAELIDRILNQEAQWNV